MKIFHLIILVLFLSIFSCKDSTKVFGVGSFPFAEKYNIKKEENNVIEQIERIKLDNNLIVPKFQWLGEEIKLNDKRKSHWYVFYIYLRDRNQIIHFYTRYDDYSNSTILALIGVRDGLGLGNWQAINKDLSEEENEEIKLIFQDKIVSKIN